MFKRQLWKHLHGDGSGSSSSSSSADEDGSEQQDTASSSQEGASSEGKCSDDDREGRPSPASGDGEEEAGQSDEDPDVQAEDVIRVWTSDDKEAQQFRGLPLRCLPCKTLLVNRAAYLNHMGSKKHTKTMKRRPASHVGQPVVVLASQASQGITEEAETHAERLQRIKRQVEDLKQQQLKQQQQQRARQKQRGTPAAAGKDLGGAQPAFGLKSPPEASGSDAGSGPTRKQPHSSTAAPSAQAGEAAAASLGGTGKQERSTPGKEGHKGRDAHGKRPGKRQREALRAAGQWTTVKGAGAGGGKASARAAGTVAPAAAGPQPTAVGGDGSARPPPGPAVKKPRVPTPTVAPGQAQQGPVASTPNLGKLQAGSAGGPTIVAGGKPTRPQTTGGKDGNTHRQTLGSGGQGQSTALGGLVAKPGRRPRQALRSIQGGGVYAKTRPAGSNKKDAHA